MPQLSEVAATRHASPLGPWRDSQRGSRPGVSCQSTLGLQTVKYLPIPIGILMGSQTEWKQLPRQAANLLPLNDLDQSQLLLWMDEEWAENRLE